MSSEVGGKRHVFEGQNRSGQMAPLIAQGEAYTLSIEK